MPVLFGRTDAKVLSSAFVPPRTMVLAPLIVARTVPLYVKAPDPLALMYTAAVVVFRRMFLLSVAAPPVYVKLPAVVPALPILICDVPAKAPTLLKERVPELIVVAPV